MSRVDCLCDDAGADFMLCGNITSVCLMALLEHTDAILHATEDEKKHFNMMVIMHDDVTELLPSAKSLVGKSQHIFVMID